MFGYGAVPHFEDDVGVGASGFVHLAKGFFAQFIHAFCAAADAGIGC